MHLSLKEQTTQRGAIRLLHQERREAMSLTEPEDTAVTAAGWSSTGKPARRGAHPYVH
jgi:hypothetical protein